MGGSSHKKGTSLKSGKAVLQFARNSERLAATPEDPKMRNYDKSPETQVTRGGYINRVGSSSVGVAQKEGGRRNVLARDTDRQKWKGEGSASCSPKKGFGFWLGGRVGKGEMGAGEARAREVRVVGRPALTLK